MYVFHIIQGILNSYALDRNSRHTRVHGMSDGSTWTRYTGRLYTLHETFEGKVMGYFSKVGMGMETFI